MSSQSPIDPSAREVMETLEAVRPGLMNELIRMFVSDAPRQMKAIENEFRSRNIEGVRQSAHFLRSGALALGIGSLAEISRLIERLELEQYATESSESLLVRLRSELHTTLMALLRQLKDH